MGSLFNCGMLVCLVMIFFQWQKNQKYYENGFLKKYASYLIGGKMGDGKTRLMTWFTETLKKAGKNTIICVNYMNGNGDIFFQSFQDFFLLQRDIQAISMYLNFDPEKKKKIDSVFPGYFQYDNFTEKYGSDFLKIKKLLAGKQLNFGTMVDEAHLYLYARLAMSNFAKAEGKKLLEMLHQTRHSNQLMVYASQDTDALDLDLRQISDKEIEVKEYFGGLFFGFNLYYYLNQKYQNLNDKLIFKKINKFPFVFLNWYALYELYNLFNGMRAKIGKKIVTVKNFAFKRSIIYTRTFDNPLKDKILPFESKFNVNINLDVYEEGDLFKKIIKKLDA